MSVMKKLVMLLSLVMLLGVVSASANTKHKVVKKHHAKTEVAAPVKKAPAKK
jgi:hypothetical protein